MNDRGFKILKALDDISKEYNSTPAAVSLAWLIARPGITAPIASATSLEQLKDITSAVKLELGTEAIDVLNTASAY